MLPIDTISNRYDKNRVSMELDAQGRTRLAYRSSDQLHYDRIDGSTIYIKVLPVEPHVVDYTLALDPQGQPHLVKIQSTDMWSGALLFAGRSGDTWLFDTISTLVDVDSAGTATECRWLSMTAKHHISAILHPTPC